MRLALLTVLALFVALAGLAGEPAKQTAKEARIAKLTKQIQRYEVSIKEAPGLAREARADGHEKTAQAYETDALASKVRLAEMRLELDWLTGKVTLAGCEVKMKAAQKAVDDATEKAKPLLQPALDAAKRELEAVKTFETAKTEF